MKVVRIEANPRDEKQVQAFLKALCELAVKEGADDARAIDCRPLPFAGREEKPPEAPPEKRSRHWPVPLYPKDDFLPALRAFGHAVVFRVDTGRGATDQGRRESLLKVYAIAMKLESAGFYGGYHLALGLAAGNCREVFCAGEEKCRALKRGSSCRHPLKARVSMEACGLDVSKIAARAGWAAPEAGEDYFVGMVLVD
jgi:predicted metal-binding protein